MSFQLHYRSSRSEVFCKKVFLGIVQNAQVFSCEFSEIFKNIFIYRTPQVAASVINDLIESILSMVHLGHHTPLYSFISRKKSNSCFNIFIIA